MKIDIDQPEKLPLGHAFLPWFEKAQVASDYCMFVVDGAPCGKSAAEHAPVQMHWWEAIGSWLKGALS